MAEDVKGTRLTAYSVVETKRHKPCLVFRGYRYVQDKIQNRTIYWRCEDRAHCNGRAHQFVDNGSLPVLTIKHNHSPMADDLTSNETVVMDGPRRQRRHKHHKAFVSQLHHADDLLLSPAAPAMTSPIKLENHLNRQHQQHLQQHSHPHGSMGKNLHLSEVITTAAAISTQHSNGLAHHRHSVVDPIEMNKLLSNITTSNSTSSKAVSTSSNVEYASRLNHFSWEEIEGRYLPVIFRNENGCLQRYTSKMFVENTLFQSESWQRHAILARSLPPLISFPYTDQELKLFRLIVEWHLASFHFKTILPSDCLIRFEDLLDFYGALRKLRDTVSTTSFSRPLPPPPIPPPIPMGPPKQRLPPSSNSSAHSFELPTMGGNSSAQKTHGLQRPHSSAKLYPPAPPPLNSAHSSNYLLQQSADLLAAFAAPSAVPAFPFAPVTSSKTTVPPVTQWNEGVAKSIDKTRPTPPRPMVPIASMPPQEPMQRDKHAALSKANQSTADVSHLSRETKESGWVQINNVFVPYIVKLKLRENELDKGSTRLPAAPLQREFYVPYEILIKCHIFSDQEFAFRKFLTKATQQDFDMFNSLISNINIFDEKTPEKTLLVNLYHVMIGLQKILYIKLLTTKQPRTQVNKYHADVLIHKGGTLLMPGNRLVPYIVQNNRFYVPLMYAYQSVPNVLSQAKRGARAPRQYEIDYLNLLFLYFSIDSPALTSDTLLVDAFSIKCSNFQSPMHFRTLTEHQQYERNRLMNAITRVAQTNPKAPMKSLPSATKSSTGATNQKSNKCLPTNVVVNPLIHHPSFYGFPSATSPIKPAATPVSSSSASLPTSSSSNSVVVNPRLLPSSNAFDFAPKVSVKQPQVKSIKYDHHTLNAIVKSPEMSTKDWKISIKHIFEQFAFLIDYSKFIQWCQTNLLLPLIKLDDEEKKISTNTNEDDYYVYQRHLDRCIALLNDLKRGTISMTLLPPSNQEMQPSPSSIVKSSLAGAKKRKTTVPTTRHVLAIQEPPLSSSPCLSAMITEPEVPSQEMNHPSPELPVGEETTLAIVDDIPADDKLLDDDDDDDGLDPMPIVAAVEEEQSVVQGCEPSDIDPSFLIVASTDGEDGKIHLDDTLPSCSSGYESAAALTNVDMNIAHHSSSDDDEDDDDTNSTTRSREHSSSCQSEQSLLPILSAVSSNIPLTATEDKDDQRKGNPREETSSPVTTLNDSELPPTSRPARQRDRQGKFQVRSRSPTPRYAKRKRPSDDPSSAPNTITSDQIEQHLRTLLMPTNEQRRTRTRPIKTPTRLVEEIASNHSIKTIESDSNVFEMLSSSPTPPITDSSLSGSSNSHEPTISQHQPCTYNVTISNKPNKLGLTIKKVVQR